MENDLKCPLCEEQYADNNLPKLLVTCGHTFCQLCLNKMITQKNQEFFIICPQDGEQVTLKDKNIKAIPKNFALVKIIQTKKGNTSFKDPELQMSKIVKSQQPQHDDQQQDIQIVNAIVLSNSIGSQQKNSIEKQQSTKQIQLDQSIKQPKMQQKCRIHKKPLQVVCILDLKKICVSCAIFGEHKGHQFKSLQEIEHERMQYYSSILKIMQKKQEVTQRISNQQTCKSIMEILSNKKNKMKNTINQKFKKLIESIQLKQKQSLRNLDSLMQKTETKLKNLMKIDPQINQKYDNWQEISYQHIKILQGNDFQSKLHLLFTQNAQQTDVLQEGDKIITQMSKQQQNLINEVQTTIENIGIQFSTQIFNHIDGFVQIFDEIKKKKPKGRTVKQQSPNKSPSIVPNIPAMKDIIQINKQFTKSNNLATNKISTINSKTQTQFFKKLSIHEQNLLDIEYESHPKQPVFTKTEEIHKQKTPQKVITPIKRQKDVISPSSKFVNKLNNQINEQISPRASKTNNMNNTNFTNFSNKKQESFIQQKIQRPNKKKLAKLKLPQKYQKIIQSLVNDQLQTLDLTNAQLGDATIILVSQFVYGSKVKTVKFIRNKLSDQSISKIIPYMKGVITLNISQNQLTQRVLDILIQNRASMQFLKTVILSQNKITQRKAKPKVDKLKSLDLVISL